MASISSSEVISVVSDVPVSFSSGGAYARHGNRIHRRIQGNLQRFSGAVFAGFEGESVVPDNLIGGLVDVEFDCEACVGEGVMATAQLDAVLGAKVCLEIKSGGNVREAGLRWLQLGMNSMIYSIYRQVQVVGRLMYFYNNDHLFYLPGDGREYWTYLSAIAWMACQIRDRQEQIGQIRRSYNRAAVTADGQYKLFVASRGEAGENKEFLRYLNKENFNQRRVMRGYKQLVIGEMASGVMKIE